MGYDLDTLLDLFYRLSHKVLHGFGIQAEIPLSTLRLVHRIEGGRRKKRVAQLHTLVFYRFTKLA